ncbi:glycoside hydrolase family 16 protein [Sorangium sp. So ce861]|uniref:glycoside hydrolase family 16 protein n=1 Tax=Sorangium sp. So ce861 TaxID=3133323 RepID=UPI003F5D5AB8
MDRRDGCAVLLTWACLGALAGCITAADEPAGAEDTASQELAEVSYSPGSGWNLVWSDEFDGSSLNTANWNVLTSNYDPVTNNCNFGTGELEYPRASNVAVRDGKLIISAQRTSDNPAAPQCTGYGGRSFYSGRIHTKGKVERRYGKISASIKVPSGYGMWPAFWTLGANIDSGANAWPRSGEIDILEWRSTEPTWMQSAVHWWNGGQADWGTGANRGTSLADSFHVYEVEWSSSSMIFRLDGSIVASNTYYHNEAEFQQNHYILLNLAIGGNWYGNPSPASIDLPSGTTKTMEVEWVRWYQQGGGSNGGSSGVSLTNPSFESGMTGWTNWSPNGTGAAGFSETYNGAQSGAYHLTHWTNGSPFEVWTYQTRSGLAAGDYKVRAWVKKGGSYDFSRLQAKTCGSCSPTYTTIGTHGAWTQIETPAIHVTGGYLEFGFHTKATAGNPASFIHMDSVELIRL